MIWEWKIYSKMYSTMCANTHHDVLTFEVDGMIQNIKNWLSQRRNMFLPRIGKILKNLFFSRDNL